MSNVETESGPFSLDRFFAETGEGPSSASGFCCESARMLRIEVDGDVWVKPGAAIAHRGALRFERRHTLDAHSVTDAIVRETAPLVRVEGRGRLYCGYRGAHVRVVRLRGQMLIVTWNDLLAFESSLEFTASLVGHGLGFAAGGLIAVRLAGDGAVALATHGQPLTLPVVQGQTLRTEPHATLAWSDSLTPTLHIDVSWRSLVAHGGQEPVQMQFDGTGFVVVQPFEDSPRFDIRFNPVKELATLIGL
jgi:uncharacterized protein (AIM24 family)